MGEIWLLKIKEHNFWFYPGRCLVLLISRALWEKSPPREKISTCLQQQNQQQQKLSYSMTQGQKVMELNLIAGGFLRRRKEQNSMCRYQYWSQEHRRLRRIFAVHPYTNSDISNIYRTWDIYWNAEKKCVFLPLFKTGPKMKRRQIRNQNHRP